MAYGKSSLVFLFQKKYCTLVCAILFSSLIAAFAEGYSFQLLYGCFSSLCLQGSIQENVLYNRYAFYSVFFAVSLQIVRSLFVFLSAFFSSKLASFVQVDVQKNLLSKMFCFSFRTISRKKKGVLTDIFSIPGTCFSTLFFHLHALCNGSIFFVVLLFFMLRISCFLTLLTLVNFLFIGKIYHWISTTAGSKSGQYRTIQEKLSGNFFEIICAIKYIHIECLQDAVGKKMGKIWEKSEKKTAEVYRWNAIVAYSLEAIAICHVAFLLTLFFFLPFLQLSTLIAFIGLSYRFAQKLPVIAQSISSLLAYSANVSSVSSFLQEPEENNKTVATVLLEKSPKKIVLDSVSLIEESTYLLQDLHLSIQQGQMIGIVGKSGSGKSCFFDLLLGLHTPTKGKILVDGQDYQTFDNSSWRKMFGVVADNTFLFHGTIEENLRFGNEFVSEKQIREACVLSKASLFIDLLAKKEKTVLEEGGIGLSSGEKQRLAIAKALLKKPPILLLDEATSHLDNLSSQAIQECLLQLQGKTTIIMATHQLDFLENADAIYVLEKGRIVEKGTQESLLQKGSLYRKLWELETAAAQKAFAHS